MKKLSTTKELQEKLQSRRNLFGLGVTSLIAACSGAAADGAGGGGGNDPLPFKAEKLLEPKSDLAKAEKLEGADAGGYSATPEWDSANMRLAVTVEKPGTPMSTIVTLNFPDGSEAGAEAGIYQLTDIGKYDLVISVPADTNNNHQGKIFIYWNVAGITNESNKHLEIKGVKVSDQIGYNPPEFLQLGGDNDNKLDMVIRSSFVDHPDNRGYLNEEGAIYILWDVANYNTGKDKTIDLNPTEIDDDDPDAPADPLQGATSGSLAIYGSGKGDYIGTFAPDFLQIGGAAGDNYDMVIRSHKVDSNDINTANPGKGAIYVLWDVEGYYKNGNAIAHKRIDLGADTNGHYATAGLLTIKGAAIGDQIGTRAPDFLQLGGAENNHDMVIRSDKVGSGSGSVTTAPGRGAIYILWDVEEYAGENTNITLDSNYVNVKDAGLLTIKGAIAEDQIGIHEAEFLQLGKKNDKYDLIIRSEEVDKADGDGTSNEGAIYVLWDVADYAGGNETINLTSLSGDATSGLLTIYGEAGSGLGSSNVLYKADNENSDNENSDVDGDGTNDLVFKDGSHTYVLFGDKIATPTDASEDAKVASKTIDLAQVNADGFFTVTFDGTGLGTSATTSGDTKQDGSVGYRFAGSKTFEAVESDFPDGLSDADADLGVWDIA